MAGYAITGTVPIRQTGLITGLKQSGVTTKKVAIITMVIVTAIMIVSYYWVLWVAHCILPLVVVSWENACWLVCLSWAAAILRMGDPKMHYINLADVKIHIDVPIESKGEEE